MTESVHPIIKIHQALGQVLKVCNRLLLLGLVWGGVFCAGLKITGQTLLAPEQALRMQGFAFNYYEATQQYISTAENKTGQATSVETDPVWDGLFAGFGLGMTAGRMVPFVGGVIFPVTGALIAYRMDQNL